jgi:hypothetical protein
MLHHMHSHIGVMTSMSACVASFDGCDMGSALVLVVTLGDADFVASVNMFSNVCEIVFVEIGILSVLCRSIVLRVEFAVCACMIEFVSCACLLRGESGHACESGSTFQMKRQYSCQLRS